MNSKLKRKLTKGAFFTVFLLVGTFSFYSFRWNYYSNHPSTEMIEEDGEYLSRQETERLIKNSDANHNYYKTFYIERTVQSGSFPSIVVVDDTVDYEVFSKKIR